MVSLRLVIVLKVLCHDVHINVAAASCHSQLRLASGHARLLGSKVPGKLPEVPTLEKMYRR